MSSYAFTDIQSMLYGTYIFEADTENGHIRSILLWKNGQLHLIVFHNGNVSTSGKITYLPIYMLMFVERQKMEGDLIYKLDLGVLQGE